MRAPSALLRTASFAVVVLASASSCGSEAVQGPDGESLAETFRARLDEVPVEEVDPPPSDCLVIDQQGADVLVEAGDLAPVTFALENVVDRSSADSAFQRCAFDEEETQNGRLVSIAAGLTPLDRDAFESALVASEQASGSFEGEAPGLESSTVFAAGLPGRWQFAWVNDGFFIDVELSFGSRNAEILTPEQADLGFRLLSEAVDEVARSIRDTDNSDDET